jgi:DNA-binding transcriptional LysR family regulator
MELYQLRTFLAVAEEGNLTRASEKLFASQPAVSAQIKLLEDELGMKLFDRSSRGMTLTRQGQLLQDKAKRIVDAARDFKHSAETLRGAVAGELVMGLNNRPEVVRIVEVLGKLSTRYPDLRYDLINGSSGAILQGIDDGTLSVGFFEGRCELPRIQWHILEPVELCVAAPAAWADELMTDNWKVLETKPWVFVSRACSYYRAIESICAEQHLTLNHRYRVNEDLTVLHLVAEEMGLTLTAKDHIESPGFKGKIIALPQFRTSFNLCFGYLKENESEPATAAARDVILEIWANSKRRRGRLTNKC